VAARRCQFAFSLPVPIRRNGRAVAGVRTEGPWAVGAATRRSSATGPPGEPRRPPPLAPGGKAFDPLEMERYTARSLR